MNVGAFGSAKISIPAAKPRFAVILGVGRSTKWTTKFTTKFEELVLPVRFALTLNGV